MAIPRKMHWTPPPLSPLSNETRQAPSPSAAPALPQAGAAGPSRHAFPVRKTPMQDKLIRRLQRQYPRPAPAPAAAASGPASVPPGARAAVLGHLLHALLRNDDTGTIAACGTATNTANGQPRFDASEIACLQGLSAWLGSQQNSSRFNSISALIYSDDATERKAAFQPFVAVQARAQVPMEDRLAGAVGRLRAQLADGAPNAPLAPDRTAGLRRLELAFFERDPAIALQVYKDIAPNDTRPPHDIDRDLKDLRKLSRGLSARTQERASIRSLHDIVASTDGAAIQRAIRPLASGNSPLEAAERLVDGAIKKLRDLSREALRMNAASSSSPRRGAKRQASGEAGESSSAAARRRVAQEEPAQAPPGQSGTADAQDDAAAAPPD